MTMAPFLFGPNLSYSHSLDQKERVISGLARIDMINQLYYAGKFGASATALPYGQGSAISLGAACAGAEGHSLNDVIRKDSLGFIINNSGQRASVLGLYDR